MYVDCAGNVPVFAFKDPRINSLPISFASAKLCHISKDYSTRFLDQSLPQVDLALRVLELPEIRSQSKILAFPGARRSFVFYDFFLEF